MEMRFKLRAACFGGTAAGSKAATPTPKVDQLVGESNEVELSIENTPCRALLDTGSMVSTLSHSFCKRLQLAINPLHDLIRVEGAGGHQLQYLGYVEASATFPDIGVPLV